MQTLRFAAAVVVVPLVSCEPTAPVERNPWIVLAITRNGNTDIWRQRLDGTDTLRLTTNAATDDRPSVAGDRVVFVSYRDGNGELYSVSLNGGAEQRLTTTTWNEADPILSPDGTRLAYTSDSTGSFKLYAGSSALNGVVPLTKNFGIPGSFDASPAWDRAGASIAFTSAPTGEVRLASVTVQAPAPSIINTAPIPSVEPSWSPVGDVIAFVSSNSGDAEISLLALGSGGLTRLTTRPGVDRRPSFLPDGRLLWLQTVSGVTRVMVMETSNPAGAQVVPTPAGQIEWIGVER